jgi:protease I
METKPLAGRRVAVFVEHKFIPEEIEAYRVGFHLLGAEVHFASRIGGSASVTFYSDVDPLDNEPFENPQTLTVRHDVTLIEEQLDTYAAVIMAANYTSVRLRWDRLPKEKLGDLTPADIAAFDARAHVQAPPVVRLFAKAMANKSLVKGALCHGLWVLTPNPRLLDGRRVICHSVVMADVLNCGALIELAPSGVVVDQDLVTGFSKHEVVPFIDAIAAQVVALQGAGP